MEKYHVGHGELQLCIEENDFGEKGEKLYAVAQKLLDMGFKVAINNFASSSLYVLQRLPSQLLKLDAKLLAKTQYNKKSVYILRNVISLAEIWSAALWRRASRIQHRSKCLPATAHSLAWAIFTECLAMRPLFLSATVTGCF